MTSASTAEAWSAVRWSPSQTASIARVRISFGMRGDAKGSQRQPSGLTALARKFASSSLPIGVSTDSGWNCTPSAGSSRWRTPMTTSSWVALTSSESGIASGSATSEW